MPGTGFSSAWSNVATFVPKFVVFLIILIVGWLIAKVITKVLSAVLTRVGFDKAVERGGIKKALESSKYDASDILAKIVYYALMLEQPAPSRPLRRLRHRGPVHSRRPDRHRHSRYHRLGRLSLIG